MNNHLLKLVDISFQERMNLDLGDDSILPLWFTNRIITENVKLIMKGTGFVLWVNEEEEEMRMDIECKFGLN